MSSRFVITLCIGLAIGLSLADIDHVFFFLRHRSAITHSVILPVLAYMLINQAERRWLRAGVVGISVGMAIHLSFDLFPRAWIGYANIHLPFIGMVGPTLSVLWILGNMVACLYLALLLLLRTGEAYTTLVAGAVGMVFSASLSSAPSFWPLVVLLITLTIAIMFPNEMIDGRSLFRRFVQQLRTQI